MTLKPERALQCLSEIKADLEAGIVTPQQAIEQLSCCGLELLPSNVIMFRVNGELVAHPYDVSTPPGVSELTWDLDEVEACFLRLRSQLGG